MYGTYETYEGKPAVRFERVYPHPVERVWRSITVPEELATWFPSTVEVDLREGGAMRFTFDPHWPSRWTATWSSSTHRRSSPSCGARTCCGSSSRRRATAPG